MKFSIAINMTRVDSTTPPKEVWQRSLDLLHIAEQGGMEVAWAAEHHAMEFWWAANPFTILADWAHRTSRIRLGIGVVVAPYWHPIRLAGEAGLIDLFSDGRLELGISRGAFNFEFARMAHGMGPEEARAHVFELVPLLKQLWAGDIAHDGVHWQFPIATATPKPIQTPHPPLWMAARDPASFDFALKHGMSIMSAPLSKPFAEVCVLADKLDTALTENVGVSRPRWMMLRNTGVYQTRAERDAIIDANVLYGKRFEGLFSTQGNVINGYPQIDDRDAGETGGHTREAVADFMVLGRPEEAVEQLEGYERAGVDLFCYNGCYQMEHALTRKSLELFVERVMPAFEV